MTEKTGSIYVRLSDISGLCAVCDLVHISGYFRLKLDIL